MDHARTFAIEVVEFIDGAETARSQYSDPAVAASAIRQLSAPAGPVRDPEYARQTLRRGAKQAKNSRKAKRK